MSVQRTPSPTAVANPQADHSIVQDTEAALKMTSVSDRRANGPFDQFCRSLLSESAENLASALPVLFGGLSSPDDAQKKNARELWDSLCLAAAPNDPISGPNNLVCRAALGLDVKTYEGKPEVFGKYCELLESLTLQGLLRHPDALQKILPVVFASLDSPDEKIGNAAKDIARQIRTCVSEVDAAVIEQFLQYAQNPLTSDGTACLQKPGALRHFCLILRDVGGERGPEAREILLQVLKGASGSSDLECNKVACDLLLMSQDIHTANDLAWFAANVCVAQETPEHLHLAVRYLDRLFEDDYHGIMDRILEAPIRHAGNMLASEDSFKRHDARDFFRHLIKHGTSAQRQLVPQNVIEHLAKGFVKEGGEFRGFNFFEELPDHQLSPEARKQLRQTTARDVHKMLLSKGTEQQFAVLFFRAFLTHSTPEQQLQYLPEADLAEVRKRLADLAEVAK
ncbi:MAG TPA: hypothetical protein VLF94_08935 [Chlamydiales bacterium]|nr:hypothetical protein [Chlamydiales bacterium]